MLITQLWLRVKILTSTYIAHVPFLYPTEKILSILPENIPEVIKILFFLSARLAV